ncbi:MAG: hypothetical protein AAGA54_04085 [Myxococcota bacterium]
MRRITLFCLLAATACAGVSTPYKPTPTSDAFAHPMVGGGIDPAELDRLVHKRAPVDLSCAPEALTVKDLGGRSVAVLGCEAKAVYIYVAGQDSWTLDSLSKPSS